MQDQFYMIKKLTVEPAKATTSNAYLNKSTALAKPSGLAKSASHRLMARGESLADLLNTSDSIIDMSTSLMRQ